MGTMEEAQSLIESLKSELSVLQEKLAAKCAAGTILTRDLEQCREDRDQFRIMFEQLRDNSRFKGSVDWSYATSNSALQHQLSVTRSRCQDQQHLVNELTQKIEEMSQDLKLLRAAERSRRVSVSNSTSLNADNIDNSDSAIQNIELLSQLENSQRKCMEAVGDIEQLSCEKDELLSERRALRLKLHRLNHQLTCALKSPNSCNSSVAVDVDALICENRHLKPMLMLAEEEVERLNKTNLKYKKALKKESRNGLSKTDGSIGHSVIASKKQVSELLRSHSIECADSVAELKSLCSALLEQLDDKCTALVHQKRTCRLLAEYNGHLRSMLEKHGLCVEPSNLLMEGYEEPPNGESENKDVKLTFSCSLCDSHASDVCLEKEESELPVDVDSSHPDKVSGSAVNTSDEFTVDESSDRGDVSENDVHCGSTSDCHLSDTGIDKRLSDCSLVRAVVADSNGSCLSLPGESASPYSCSDHIADYSSELSETSSAERPDGNHPSQGSPHID